MQKKKSGSRTVTMRDVAKLAGVSQSTVSRVLSQAASDIPISEETNARVHAAVKALGYYPNVTARSLRTQHTQLIAVMIADISNAFYHVIARTIQDIATQHNYDVLISNTDHILEYERRFCEAMMRRPVDGIVLIPYHLTDTDIDLLIERTGAAISVLGDHIHHPNVDVVSADDETATYETVYWLLQQKGHQRIAYLGAEASSSVNVRRERGYQRAMQDAGLTIDPDWVQAGSFTHESGRDMMQTLLAHPARPTAVIACNDMMAIGALNAVLDSGLRVPQDVAIVGFDDIPAAKLIRPTLTTIAQYPEEIGRHLANSLFERIEGGNTDAARHFEVPLELIIRQST